jgi:hypothetical protein
MKIITFEKNENVLHFVILLTLLISPYFFLKSLFFNFVTGTSFALVDFFLAVLVLLGIKNVLQNRISLSFDKQFRNIFFTGIIFISLCLLSGMTSFIVSSQLNLWALLCGTAQYAFIFIGFPLIALFFLSKDDIKPLIRYISLAYLLPMLITILILLLPLINGDEITRVLYSGVFYANGRAQGTFENANSFAFVLLITFPFYVYLTATEKGFWKAIGVIGSISFVPCFFLTACFSGVLVFFLFIIFNLLLIILWKNNPLRRKLKNIIFCGVLIIIIPLVSIYSLSIVSYYSPTINNLYWVLSRNVTQRLFSSQTSVETEKFREKFSSKSLQEAKKTDGQPSILTKFLSSNAFHSAFFRMSLNYKAWNLIKERGGGFFFGHGLLQSSFLPTFDYGVNGKTEPHLIYLLLWSEGGLILALAYSFYLLLLSYNCIRLAKTHPREALALGGVILAFALCGFFYPHNFLRHFWIPLLPAFITNKGPSIFTRHITLRRHQAVD